MVAVAGLPIALGAAGCASVPSVTSEVASFGEWPAGRAPGRFAFDALPSQRATPEAAEALARLEAAARAALEQAGFGAAMAGERPDVLVQLGQRSARVLVPGPWDDPLWWRGGFGPWRTGAWVGTPWGPVPARPGWPGWTGWHGAGWSDVRWEREVALLLRDAASGRPLYEARAATSSVVRGDDEQAAALFRAALSGFPAAAAGPRRVTVPL
jgi:hypothetical protein